MKQINLPRLGASFRVLTGGHQGETATVLSVREAFAGDPVVTVKTSTGMLSHWRPGWGQCGMPQIEALPASAR